MSDRYIISALLNLRELDINKIRENLKDCVFEINKSCDYIKKMDKCNIELAEWSDAINNELNEYSSTWGSEISYNNYVCDRIKFCNQLFYYILSLKTIIISRTNNILHGYKTIPKEKIAEFMKIREENMEKSYMIDSTYKYIVENELAMINKGITDQDIICNLNLRINQHLLDKNFLLEKEVYARNISSSSLSQADRRILGSLNSIFKRLRICYAQFCRSNFDLYEFCRKEQLAAGLIKINI